MGSADDLADMPADDAGSVEAATLADLEDATRVRLFEGEPRAVRLALAAGETIPSHSHPERQIVCHVLEGHLEITLSGTEHGVEAGQLLRFDGEEEIALEALEDSVAVLVLAPRAD